MLDDNAVGGSVVMSSIEVSIQLTTNGFVSFVILSSSQGGLRYEGIELGTLDGTVVFVVLSSIGIIGTNALVPSLGFFFLLPNTVPIMTASIRSRMDNKRHTFLLVGLKRLATVVPLSFVSPACSSLPESLSELPGLPEPVV